MRLRRWIEPPRQFELQRGLDTVLTHVREALLATRADASAPPQATAKENT